jgi:hypothetical protein
MMHLPTVSVRVVATLLLLLAGLPARAGGLPAWLPRYDVAIDLDVAGHVAHVRQRATWTNPCQRPAHELVFNAHSHYVVPSGEVGFMAKTLEILRMNPEDSLGEDKPALEVNKAFVESPSAVGKPAVATEIDKHFEGDTNTTLVVPLPRAVGPGESVTVVLDLTMRLPPKFGRWGQWCGVTYLSNWLPVFAVYTDWEEPRIEEDGPKAAKTNPKDAPPSGASASILEKGWHPTPFVPWHQPWFNESGIYNVSVTLPHDQQVACSGTVVAERELPDGKKQIEIQAPGVRDFAFLCSAKYQVHEGHVAVKPGTNPVRVRILALPEHEFYAKEMVRIAGEVIATYSRWFGPYPYPDFTIAEAFFGWNGNECGGLVMIDDRVFGMPHLACGYVEYLVSHEICHQWWYNVVGTNGFCETWMDEAMAVFFTHKLTDQKRGKNNPLLQYPAGLEWLPNIHREDYRAYSMYGTFGRGENGPVVQPMTGFGHVVNLFSLCYDKGARIVGMIEERLGEAAFMDFMRLVYNRYQYRIIRVADYQRELEAYTGYSWHEFFRDWIYGRGLSDWSVEKVTLRGPPKCRAEKWCGGCTLGSWMGKVKTIKCTTASGPYRVTVLLHQKAEYNEQTTLGFALPGCEGYPIRVPILPQAGHYELENPPAVIDVLDGNRVRVQIELADEPTQIAVDPDQVLVDKDPSNNFWKPPIRFRVTPLYTFLEETDLTNAYDRWNVIVGPWIYGPAYDDVWYTRSTMVGMRAGAYRTQEFNGGVYAAYRTDYRDVVAGVDGMWDHWPYSHVQIGFNAERRLRIFENGDNDAMRGVVYGRYVFQYGSSLYLPPMHYVELFGQYQDNFLPVAEQPIIFGERFNRSTTAGIHYRINYLTPYWDPEGGFQFDLTYEGGWVELVRDQGLHKVSSQFAMVKGLPDLTSQLDGLPALQGVTRPALEWLADTRLAMRLYGATGVPARGEYFSMGGSELFRGFDLAQRQGSTVWVGSLEWRVPLARRLTLDAADHLVGLRNLYGAVFYDVGDAYSSGHQVGPIAHGVGGGLRLDLAWFSFVERTMLRLDVAKAINTDTGVQVWFGVQHPF